MRLWSSTPIGQVATVLRPAPKDQYLAKRHHVSRGLWLNEEEEKRRGAEEVQWGDRWVIW